ncbi:MAG: hypothetical protein M3315_10020 [Actinomycetota bacterium]|nr:hypothetical protein [Actinomycetota bacterium]
MSAEHESNKLRPIDRLLWLKVILALAFLNGFLLSVELWGVSRTYPLTPVLESLPAVPPLLSQIWFVALLILLVAIVVIRRPRQYILAFVVLAGLLSLFDQSRWQPWFYQYLFMFVALALYPWRDQDPEKREAVLNICRLIVASTYFWSGLQKLNVNFVEDLFPWLVEPLVALLPGSTGELVRPLGITVPFIEAGIGIGLLTRFRNVAVILALGMHVFILFCIGPLGYGWNTVVWPWNLAMMLFVVILFWQTENCSPGKILLPKTTIHGLVLLLFGLMPLFSFFDLWDAYLSASLYSANTKSATIYVSEAEKNNLPKKIRDLALKSEANGTNILSITDWSWEELNVPFYPESRVFRNVAKHVCSYVGNPSEVKLVIKGKPAPINGTRQAESYDCSGLDTGEHKTEKLER